MRGEGKENDEAAHCMAGHQGREQEESSLPLPGVSRVAHVELRDCERVDAGRTTSRGAREGAVKLEEERELMRGSSCYKMETIKLTSCCVKCRRWTS